MKGAISGLSSVTRTSDVGSAALSTTQSFHCTDTATVTSGSPRLDYIAASGILANAFGNAVASVSGMAITVV